MLLRRAGIKGLPGNRRPRPRHQTPTSHDLVHRDFSRPESNQLWVTDITEHPTREGKIYCAVVLDTFSQGRGVVHRLDPDVHVGHQRAEQGDQQPRAHSHDRPLRLCRGLR
jgi:transposase InsO family protein